VSVQDFIKTIAPESEALKAIRADAKAKGTDKLTMREINAEMAAYRSEQRQKAVKRSTGLDDPDCHRHQCWVTANIETKGAESRVSDLVTARRLQLYVSEVIMAEYRRVLTRPKLRLDPKRVLDSD
jgi:hypothetical protein